MTWMKNHKKLCIIIAVLIVVAVAIAIGVTSKKGDKKTSNEETVVVEKRTLMKGVSATGKFVASEEEKVTSDTTGAEILAVNVKVGDKVNAGDTICVLDTKDIKKQLDSAKESQKTSQEQSNRNKDQAKRNLDQAGVDRDENLKKVDSDIADAKDNWDKSESTYQESAKAYNDAKAALDAMADKASAQYVSASAQVNNLKRQMDGDRITADAYKKQYDNQVSNRGDRITQINNNYQNQVDAYNNMMDSTRNPGEAQQDRIDQLQKQLDGAVVKAKTSGLVTSVNAEVGKRYNGSVLAIINNVDSFDVTTEIGEYDINNIAVGQDVIIKTNATGDEELAGVVKEISPIATGEGGSNLPDGLGFDVGSMLGGSDISSLGNSSKDVTFTVRIGVNTQSEKLRIGMTAKLNIILEKNADVLAVPYNAVQQEKNGDLFVQEVTGKDEEGKYKTKKVSVLKGMESDYYTEILDCDLKEGAKILLPATKKGESIEDMISTSGTKGGI